MLHFGVRQHTAILLNRWRCFHCLFEDAEFPVIVISGYGFKFALGKTSVDLMSGFSVFENLCWLQLWLLVPCDSRSCACVQVVKDSLTLKVTLSWTYQKLPPLICLKTLNSKVSILLIRSDPTILVFTFNGFAFGSRILIPFAKHYSFHCYHVNIWRSRFIGVSA